MSVATQSEWKEWVSQTIQFPAYPWLSWWDNLLKICDAG